MKNFTNDLYLFDIYCQERFYIMLKADCSCFQVCSSSRDVSSGCFAALRVWLWKRNPTLDSHNLFHLLEHTRKSLQGYVFCMDELSCNRFDWTWIVFWILRLFVIASYVPLCPFVSYNPIVVSKPLVHIFFNSISSLFCVNIFAWMWID